MRKITDLPVRLLDEKTRVELIERGKLWKRVAIGTHYMQYKGNIIRKHWFGSNYFKAYVTLPLRLRKHPKIYEYLNTVMEELWLMEPTSVA